MFFLFFLIARYKKRMVSFSCVAGIFRIVPDKLLHISRQLKAWAQEGDGWCNLVLTTGGTGFSQSDITPEATDSILDKRAPGLVHTMFQYGLQVCVVHAKKMC